jgi:tetratricopeptide (TPR) repeat protein
MQRQELSPAQHVAIGDRNLASGNYTTALDSYQKALELAPNQAEYQWKACQAASRLRWKRLAQKYAMATWQQGEKTEEVLFALVASMDPRNDRDLALALKLAGEMPDEAGRDKILGQLYFAFAKYAQSTTTWTPLYEKSPSPQLADWLAVAWMRQGKPVKGRQVLREQHAAGGLDSQGYGILAALEALADQYPAAESLYLEADKQGSLTTELRLRYAVLLFVAGKRSEAIAEFDKLKNLSNVPLPLTQKEPGDTALPTEAVDEVLRIRGRVVSSVARIYLAHLLLSGQDGSAAEAGDPGSSLNGLESLAKGQEDLLKGERLFYQTMRSADLTDQVRLRQLRQALKLTSGHPIVSLYLARTLLGVGKPTEALRNYDGLMETESLLARSVLVELEKANAQIQAGQSREAIQALRSLHARGLYSKASLALARDLARQMQLPDESWRVQEFLSKAFPDDVSVAWGRGQLALSSGKVDEAEQVFGKMLEAHPDLKTVEVAQLMVLLSKKKYAEVLVECAKVQDMPGQMALLKALANQGLGRRQEAKAAYRQALEAWDNPPMKVAYANMLLDDGEVDQARNAYGEVLAVLPDDVDAQLGMALIALRQGEWQKAEGWTNKLLGKAVLAQIKQKKAIARAYWVQAVLGVQRHDFARALENCGLALFYDGSFLQAKLLQAWLLERQGRGNLAAESLLASLDLMPAAVLWARLSLRHGQTVDVLQVLKRHQLTGKTWADMGQEAEKRQLWEVARECYAQALALIPQNPALLNNMAWVTLHAGKYDPEELLKLASQAYAALPGQQAALDTYANVLLALGQQQRAIELLEKSARISDAAPGLVYCLAQAYEKDRKPQMALAEYRRCQTLLNVAKDSSPASEAVVDLVEKVAAKISVLER